MLRDAARRRPAPASIAEPDARARLARLQAERLARHRVLPPRPLRDARGAAAFVRERRIVLETGRASLPSLTDAIAGRRIQGSWMADPEVHRIHRIALAVHRSRAFLEAPLVQGKATYVVPALAAAVERVASDPDRVRAARGALSPLAATLLADVEARGEVRMDGWRDPGERGRAARLALERALLVVSRSVHTESGRHTAIVAPWATSALARAAKRAAARLGYDDATEALFGAALRSAVVAPEREARGWFVFGDAPLARLAERGDVERIVVGRIAWLAAR